MLHRPGLSPLEVAITCDHEVEDDYVSKDGKRTAKQISPEDKTCTGQTIVEYPANLDILGEISRTERYMKAEPQDPYGHAYLKKFEGIPA